MKGGWACTPPPSPARAYFTLMECTPESSRCYSVFSVGRRGVISLFKWFLPAVPHVEEGGGIGTLWISSPLLVCSCVRVCPTWRMSGRCPWSATGGRRWRWWGGAASASPSSAFPAPLTSAPLAWSFRPSSAQKVRDNNHHHLSTVNVVTCPIGFGPLSEAGTEGFVKIICTIYSVLYLYNKCGLFFYYILYLYVLVVP
jgi:hypothetical protein